LNKIDEELEVDVDADIRSDKTIENLSTQSKEKGF